MNHFPKRWPASGSLATAHAALRPVAVEAPLLARCLAGAGIRATRIWRLPGPAVPPFGFFKVDGGLVSYFVKVLDSSDAESQNRAARIAERVKRAGAPACAPVQSLTLNFDSHNESVESERLWAFVYPWIQARPPDPAPETMARLGRGLATLHHAFRGEHAWLFDQFSAIAEARTAWLARAASDLEALSAKAPEHHRGWVSEALRGFERHPLHALADQPERFIHGDLNLGNMLVVDGGEVVFLDFEETARTIAAPACDTSNLLERVVFVTDLSDAEKISAVERFWAAYSAELGEAPCPEAIIDGLHWCFLRSVALLCAPESIEWPETEWVKFQTLAAGLPAARTLLRRLA